MTRELVERLNISTYCQTRKQTALNQVLTRGQSNLTKGRIVAPKIRARSALTEPEVCLLYTSPSPRDGLLSRMPSSA